MEPSKPRLMRAALGELDAAAALDLDLEQRHRILHVGDLQPLALEHALLDLGARVVGLVGEVGRPAIDRHREQPRRRLAAAHVGLEVAGEPARHLDDQRPEIVLEEGARGASRRPPSPRSAESQIFFHSAGVIVLKPPSVAILVSGPAVSLGQERRNETSASACLSSAQPAISLKEIGAIATRCSFAGLVPSAQAASRPAAASQAATPDRTVQRIIERASLSLRFLS